MNESSLNKLPDGKVEILRPHPMLRLLQEDVATDEIIRPPGAVETDKIDNARDNRQEIADISILNGCRLMVLGAGSVGAYVAYFLAAAFHAVIYLLDYDKVETKNTVSGRSIYKAGFTGTRKVFAAKEIIEADFPNSRILPLPNDVMDLPDIELLRLARNSCAAICAIDDAAAMLRINRVLYSNITVLYPAMHNSAKTGHIILTIPGKSACLQCSMDIDDPGQIQTLHGEPGWGLDIRNVANHCATIVTQLIYAEKTNKNIGRWDSEKNIFYFANTRHDLSPDGPGIVLQAAHKRLGCPVCSS